MKETIEKSEDIFVRMNNRTLFTDAEWNVILYLMNNRHDIPDMNIRTLAENTYVANGTIIRICRKLGLSGFRELKMEALKSNERRRYQKSEVNYNFPLRKDETVDQLIGDMQALYRETVNAVAEFIDKKSLKKTADTMIQADRILIFAIGTNMFLAELFASRLSMLGYNTCIASQYSEQYHIARHAQKGDAAFFISYGGESGEINQCLIPLKKQNVPVVSLTSSSDSLLQKMSDSSILIPYMESRNKTTTFYSQAAFSYVLNLLYAIFKIEKM